MRSARLGATIGVLGAGCAIVLAAVDCAAPTQIVLDVYTDGCGKGINATGVAVGTADDIDAKRPTAFRNGCDAPGHVGSLTIFPSGASDAEVTIKVLTGVDKSPDLCEPPAYDGCIVHRRTVQFVKHSTQRVVVQMLLACLDSHCPAGTECVANGACVSRGDVLDDGGVKADASELEASADSAPPPPVCDPALCQGGPRQGCDGGICVVACAGGAKCDGDASVCPAGLACAVSCGKEGDCPHIDCDTTSSCSIACDGDNSCPDVTCNAASCAISCQGKNACAKIRVDAGSSASTCIKPGGPEKTCADFRCAGGSCELGCPTAADGCGMGDRRCCAASCSGQFTANGPTACAGP